jgi:nucleotide-binding universal stress UspA family protein
MAHALRARVVVASVMWAAVSVGPSWCADSVAEEVRHDELLRQARHRLVRMGVAFESVPAIGEPARAIVDLAEAHRAELIVVGSGYGHLVDRLVHGGAGIAVSRCDVLIVH